MQDKLENKIPLKLYKYSKLEYAEKAIHHGVFASHLDKVNDPYEVEGIQYPDDYRICCMTNSPRKMLLWSYYLNHNGCVIEYDVSRYIEQNPDLIKKVFYEESLRNPHRLLSPDEICLSLYRKSQEWEHENEYRAVFFRNNYDSNTWKFEGDEVYLNVKVTKVTFGLMVSDDNNIYIELLKMIGDYNITNVDSRIKVSKCILKQDKYEIIEDPQYDYTRLLR